MLQMVFITLLLAFAFGSNEVSLLRSATDLQIMVKDFTRSDEAPQAPMATIATQMSAPHAVEQWSERYGVHVAKLFRRVVAACADHERWAAELGAGRNRAGALEVLGLELKRHDEERQHDTRQRRIKTE